MKYEIVHTAQNDTFLLDCPIQLVKEMVAQDQETGIYYLNVQYFSMVRKEIKTICLKLSVKTRGAIKSNVSYIFHPKNGKGLMKNDKPHPFHMGEYKSVDVLVSRVAFCDGSVWVCPSKPQTCVVPEKADITEFDKYRGQIQEKFGDLKVKYAYSENQHLWRCPCGCVNQDEKCFACGGYKIETRNFFNKERLEIEYGWIQEELATKETNQVFLQEIQETKRYSEIFDSIIVNAHSQNSEDIANAIMTINEIMPEDMFLKKVQAIELLAMAEDRFQQRRAKQVEFKHLMASISHKLSDRKRRIAARAKRRTKIATVATATLSSMMIFIVAVAYILTSYVIPEWKYTSGMTSYQNGEYNVAIAIFTELDGYEDSQEMIVESWYQIAVDYIERYDYNNARSVFSALDGYKESAQYLIDADVMEGEDYLNQGRYQDALDMFAIVADVDGVAIMQDQCYYGLATTAYAAGDEDSALELFILANDYSNSDDYIISIIRAKAEGFYQAGDYGSLISLLENRDDDFVYTYLAEVVPIYETYAKTYYDNGDYATSKTMYQIMTNVTEYLGTSAAKRVVAYPIFCDARLYANNYDDVIAVFDLSYESYNVIEDVSGYMVKFLSDSKWVYVYTSTSTDSSSSNDTYVSTTTRYMEVDEYGYAELSLQESTTGEGNLSYYDGSLYIDGEEIAQLRITSYSSITFTIKKTDYDYARTNS